MDRITEDIHLAMGLDTILIQRREGMRPDTVGRRIGTIEAISTIIPALSSAIASILILFPATMMLTVRVIIAGNPLTVCLDPAGASFTPAGRVSFNSFQVQFS